MEPTYYWVYEINQDREGLAISTIDKKERADMYVDTMRTFLDKSLYDCGYTNKLTTQQIEDLMIHLGATLLRVE